MVNHDSGKRTGPPESTGETGRGDVRRGIALLRESQAKTDEQMRRTDAKLDPIGKQLGELSLVQGEVAEDLPCYPFWLLALH